jgi:pilus assembly protein CpaB
MRKPVGFFILTILAATLASVVVYSSLKKKQAELDRARAGLASVVVAARNLSVGTKLDPTAVRLAQWPRDSLPPGVMVDPHAVQGMITKTEFVENEPLVASRLVSAEMTSGVLPLMIPKDLRAMSVAVDEVADMAGFILPYTRVDVLLAVNGGGSGDSSGRSKIILENVPVLAVAQTLERKDQPQPERVVTLMVTPEEAERLALAEGQGKLHLALRNYADNDLVATGGANLQKVMNAFTLDAPPPQPTQQPVAVHVKFARIPRRMPERVEVLRNGHMSEVVTMGRTGHPAFTSLASAQAEQDGSGVADDPPSNANELSGNDDMASGSEMGGGGAAGVTASSGGLGTP